jgi:ElaB/YqjD/DUF883 family membrane-anchored ribosome-binding protein
MATTTNTTQQAKNAVSSGVDKVKDAVQSGAEKTKDTVNAGIDKAKDLASAGYEKAKDAASAGYEKAKDVAHVGYEKAKDLASSAGKMAENATSSVGSGMESLGHTIRDKAPHEGMIGSAASTVANTLEQGGRYLREEGLSGLADDMTNTIRRNPIQSILVAVAVGFLLARATRS